jgi:hypothetical protein
MAKFKTYDYRQRVFLPVSLEDQLIAGNPGVCYSYPGGNAVGYGHLSWQIP